MGKLVVLKFERGDFQNGFDVTLRISEDGGRLLTEISGKFSPASNIPILYDRWQSDYKKLKLCWRITVGEGSSSNTRSIPKQCRKSAKEFKDSLLNWLNSADRQFQKIREALIKFLRDEHEAIRVIIQTQDPLLRKIPWHEWELFANTYTQSEIALSPPEFNRVYREVVDDIPPCKDKVRILAILGNSTGIDIDKDRQFLEKFPDSEIILLVEPKRQNFNEYLWDKEGYDILFFAGHSESQADTKTGYIYINPTDSITMDDLKYSLNRAIKRGLKIAIFNSCDGLGLAHELADLDIPQIITMRESVPDRVAQEFLKYFLSGFSGDKSLYLAVREAREKLQGLEDEFPCATWMPVICQNPAEQILTWRELLGLKPRYANRETPLSQQEYRERKIMLKKVKDYWVKGVLERSLHNQAMIELGLEKRLDKVDLPWGIVWPNPNEQRQTMPPGTRVIDLFDQMGSGRTLLILGDPGSGKTITLLEIARHLIARAETDVNHPIPVVFNLSTWGNEKLRITDWLVEELRAKYKVNKQVARAWVDSEEMLLLLDGLDEVHIKSQNLCLEALNEFSREYGKTDILVCSRVQDYEALSKQLGFQSAVSLQPLESEQINYFIRRLGSQFSTLKEAMKEDKTLQQLAKSPLMLNIMSLAYQGMSVEELLMINSIEQRPTHILNSYIKRMSYRRQRVKQHYEIERTEHWLTCLGKRMKQESQTIFLIEHMQPNIWNKKIHKYFYIVGCGLIFGTICAGIVGLIVWLTIGILFERFWGLVLVLTISLLVGIPSGLWACITVGRSKEIETVETLNWSIANIAKSLAAGAIAGLVTWQFSGMIAFLIVGLMLGLIYGVSGSKIEKTKFPNQGIWQSLKIAIIFAGIGTIAMGIPAVLMAKELLSMITNSSFLQTRVGVLNVMLSAILVGLFFGITQAGVACIQHLVLRIVLYFNGYIPWNYAHFLDRATDRIFLQKVGGGYIFIHRILRDHFAELKP